MGPLNGVTIIELAGIGPAPFCGMMLADMGARVIRVDRPGSTARPNDVANRGKESIAIDLKHPDGIATLLDLCRAADGLIEGFRPGVTERLGIGPDECLAANPALIYGRMTGWGQDGPLANAAGHDMNYIALTGALHAIGPLGAKPVPPLNLIGDFGGGGMLLAFGMVCAVLEARTSGEGQVIDAAMVDGTAALMAMAWQSHAAGRFDGAPGASRLAGAPHFYDTYETADDKFVSIGSLEPQFYALLLDKLGRTDDELLLARDDPDNWPASKQLLAEIFRTKTRDEWCAVMEGTDICFAPILDITEVPDHPHNVARNAYVERDGVTQPAPAPRFSRTPGEIGGQPPEVGRDSEAILQSLNLDDDRVSTLLSSGAVSQR